MNEGLLPPRIGGFGDAWGDPLGGYIPPPRRHGAPDAPLA
jgi:hypothetical protein